MKKYELTEETIEICGRTLYRIKALISFAGVQEGELGGYIERGENLSQVGDAWVFGNAQVYGNAQVFGNAQVYDKAQVSGNAWVSGEAKVYGKAWVYGNAQVFDNAKVYDKAKVYDNAWVSGKAQVSGEAKVYGKAQVSGEAQVCKIEHILTIGPCGSRNEYTTFFRDKDNEITVTCGCFTGKQQEFLKQVKETHGENKFAKVYHAAAEMARLQIELK